MAAIQPLPNPVQLFQKLLQKRRGRPYLLLSGLCAISACLYCSKPANAAQTVIVQYADQRATVSLTELQTFVEGGEATPELQALIQQIPTREAFGRQIFARVLPLRFAPSGDQEISRNAQFILYQINKLVGEPSGEANYPVLRQALIEASINRPGLTIMRLLEVYPETTVRVDLLNLEQIFNDISLYLERLQPLLQSRQLIHDWFCECPAPAAAILTAASSPSSSRSFNCGPNLQLLHTQADLQDWGENGQALLSVLLALEWLTQSSGESIPGDQNGTDLGFSMLLQNRQLNYRNSIAEYRLRNIPGDIPDYQTAHDKRLVFRFGPFGRSISVAELSQFAETGEASKTLQAYLDIADLDPVNVRSILNQQVTVDFRLVDRALSSLLGEYVLFRISDVLHTSSQQADIPALRSALLLSAADDNRISAIEFLQRFPTQQIYVDGVVLLRAVQFTRRTLQQDLGQVTDRIADWLENVQRTIAAEICDCQLPDNELPSEPESGEISRDLKSLIEQSSN
ncbi:alpha/beta hydrolase [Leptolyngbya sp. 7M]|uniref:alpha/beta hydrolase n=1 Tax=Leptolyngbya sp. 7M TaxID=2812896 RepID=UPI001B8C4512|nr:alpha/beta hydrolase [Leptolyngbya sp. 7M]QYO67787.1 alpha/beta hydrolase [Leptolyngbya sp. 7M]